MSRLVRLGLALAMLLAAPSSLLGQMGIGAVVQDRPELDYFLSHYRGEGEAEAVGARLMWPLGRGAVGGYLVRSPDDQPWIHGWRYGAQADLRVTRLPVGGRLDPFLSLGLGASRLSDGGDPERRERLFGQARTHLSVAPGVGLRFRLGPGFGLRGDARQVLDFHDGVKRNLELSGGLSLGV